MEKIYVEVEYEKTDGCTYPKTVAWPDGRIYRIAQILESGLHTFGNVQVYRYSVVIQSKRRFLYEDTDGRWFVIAKQ